MPYALQVLWFLGVQQIMRQNEEVPGHKRERETGGQASPSEIDQPTQQVMRMYAMPLCIEEQPPASTQLAWLDITHGNFLELHLH